MTSICPTCGAAQPPAAPVDARDGSEQWQFAQRLQAYLDDAPIEGRHSDAAGGNAYDLIAEAIEWMKSAAPVETKRTPLDLSPTELNQMAVYAFKAADLSHSSAATGDAMKAIKDLEMFIGDVEGSEAAEGGTIDGTEAAAALDVLRTMPAEIAALKHDIERHVQIAADLANEPQPTQVTADQAAEDVRREREAKAERDRYAKMTTAEKCAVQGDGFINDYD